MNPFDAIEAAIHAVHPGAELQFSGGVPSRTEPLNGFVFTRVMTPTPHWLVVSQGNTELWAKESDDPEISGFGYELTCRVPAETADLTFGWVMTWMQHLCDRIAESNSWLDAFHHMRMSEPVREDEQCAVVLCDDVQLRPTASVNGSFRFLQVVGLTLPELESMRRWDARSFLELMKTRDPLLVFDAKRESLLADPSFARAVAEGTARDGSSLAVAMSASVLWFQHDGEVQVHLGRGSLEMCAATLASVASGRTAMWRGDVTRSNSLVVLAPGEGRTEVETRGDSTAAVIHLGDAARACLAAVLERAATERGGPTAHAVPGAEGLRLVVADDAIFEAPSYPF